MTEKIIDLNHLEWSIRCRANNQKWSLRLLRLFHSHEKRWETKDYSRAAQELVAVSFSLWRAAFLAEKKGSRRLVFAQGRKFLERVIEDNAISYPNDKSSLEWTFNYYTNNARHSLERLNAMYPTLVPEFEAKRMVPKARWEHCQHHFESAVSAFEGHFAGLDREATERAAATLQRKTAKAATVLRRAKSRETTRV